MKESKNNRQNSAITLIALVITIIILLILAGITISQLTGSGLFENSKLAKEKYENEQKMENDILSEYNKKIDIIIGNRDDLATKEEIKQEIKNEIIYVKKRWKNGQNYYTIYSDGWVEQGGLATGNDAIKTISLHIKFADTNYNVQCTSKYNISDSTLYHPHIEDLTTTSFKSASYGERGSNTNTNGVPVYWRAEGYGDVDILKTIN